MPNTWVKNYEDLVEYIAKHPDIEISKKSVVILDDVRPGFYQLFDALRSNFIREKFTEELGKGAILSKDWGKARRVVFDSLNLDSIDIQAGTKWFLLDPLDGLTRGLFDPLFKLLKHEFDLATFEQKTMETVTSDFNKFMRDGYRRLATITMINMLLPDEIYSVPARDFYSDPVMQEGDLDDGLHEENLPDVIPTRQISFEQPLLCSFLTSRIIVHSSKLGRFVAFRPDYYGARWKARQVSPAQEWISIKKIEEEFGRNGLWPDLLIYSANSKEDLTLVADYHRIARPDIIIDFKEEAGWYEKEGLEVVKRHFNILNPKLGSFVICREPVPAAALNELAPKPAVQPASAGIQSLKPSAPAGQSPGQVSDVGTLQPVEPKYNIHLLHVGNDMAQLESVINALT